MYTFAALTALSPLLAGTQDRADFAGAWVQSGGADSWVFKTTPDGLHVTQVERKATVADFDCRTDGEDCVVKIAGHKASVSMYYNGSVLVELETKGDQIVKRRFQLQPSGGSLKIEVTNMNGRVPATELEFTRVANPAR